ncbi:hypothetical protein EDC04DRAFT_3091690, partial [Pisolithus marmoratus]
MQGVSNRIKTSTENISDARTRRYIKSWMKQPNGLPASTIRPPNGLVYPPGTLRDPRRRRRIKTRPKNVSKSRPRGCKRLMLLIIPIPPPRKLVRPLWNVANTYWRHGIPPGRMQNDGKLAIFKTAASRSWYKVKARAHYRHIRNGKLPQRGVANTTTQHSHIMDSRLHLQQLYSFYANSRPIFFTPPNHTVELQG